MRPGDTLAEPHVASRAEPHVGLLGDTACRTVVRGERPITTVAVFIINRSWKAEPRSTSSSIPDFLGSCLPATAG